MSLAKNFIFSQNNLQDYIDCPRRFELRYILGILWPAIQSEPVLELEHQMELGKYFHQLIQQDVAGIPRETLDHQAFSLGIEEWWKNYTGYDPLSSLPPRRFSEFQLSTSLAGKRVTAKYDLIAISQDSSVIIDWKTSVKQTPVDILIKRLQTIIYPYILVEAGKSINQGIPVRPEQVQMVFWFANFPSKPISIQYSAQKHEEARDFLTRMIKDICIRPDGQFALTPDEKKCLFCNYRTLCGRGIQPGDWKDQEEGEGEETSPPINLDLEQIGEIEF